MAFEPVPTRRLLLRPVVESDADALASRRDDPEIARYQGWKTPYTLEMARELTAAASAEAAPAPDEWWMLTVTDARDGAILGDLSMKASQEGRSVEIGYTLDRTAWGRGYAAEAVEALLARLFESPATKRVQAMLHPDNVASAQVLERNGFVYEGRTRLSYGLGQFNDDDVLYGIIRSDWETWQHRRRTPPDDVRLVEVTRANAAEVRGLRTHKSQERFVAPVTASFADALVPEVVDGAPLSPWMRAVEADGELVGFVMMSLPTAHHPLPMLWRLLIDRLHQRRGVGARVVELVIAECTALGADSMLVSWCEGRGSPAPLYLGRGFVPTGRLIDGEVEALLRLEPADD